MMDLTARDWLSAIAAMTIVTVLFCARLVGDNGSVLSVAFLLLYALPTALFIFLVVELPLLSWIRHRSRNVAAYILIPFISMLTVSLGLFFLNSGSSSLQTVGVIWIDNGRIRWENFGHIVVGTMEPAIWAGLAGLIYWFFAVRRLSSNLPS